MKKIFWESKIKIDLQVDQKEENVRTIGKGLEFSTTFKDLKTHFRWDKVEDKDRVYVKNVLSYPIFWCDKGFWSGFY